MLRNFRALKMTVSLESVMHNNGQRDTGLELPQQDDVVLGQAGDFEAIRVVLPL